MGRLCVWGEEVKGPSVVLWVVRYYVPSQVHVRSAVGALRWVGRWLRPPEARVTSSRVSSPLPDARSGTSLALHLVAEISHFSDAL